MTNHETLAAALVAAQAELKNPHKDQTAEVPTKSGGKYTYAYVGLATVIDAVRPILSRHGIAVVQNPSFVPGTNRDGLASVETVLIHGPSGQREASTLALPCDATPQAIGSAITYARRYGLQSMVGIFADEDDDAAKATGGPRTPERAARKAAAPKPPRDPIMDARVAFFQSYQTAQRVGVVTGRETSTEDGKRALLSNLCGFKVENVEALRLDQWQAAKLSLDEKIADARAAAQ